MISPTDALPGGSSPSVSNRRFAAGLEYDGSGFHGWQHQSHARSVQTELDRAIARVANHPVSSAAAGRTDAGVHATGQVIHFESPSIRTEREWTLGINSNLPDDIAVQWVRAVPPNFHARYSAIARTYRYVILNRAIRSALERHRAWALRGPLDESAMAASGAALLGEHDFSAFRAAGCQAKTAVKRIHRLAVERRLDYLIVEVTATGFLYHMVRNIVGALVRVGSQEASVSWVAELLATRDRTQGAPTAPPEGLFLSEIHYPPELGLPRPWPLPVWADR